MATGAFIFILLVVIFRLLVSRTLRKRMEASLRKSEEQHRLLTEYAISTIAAHEIILDEVGKPVDYLFLSANPTFETHTGLKRDELPGRRATEVLPGIENHRSSKSLDVSR